MSKHTADLLRKAKARIGTPEKWCKGTLFEGVRYGEKISIIPEDCPACAMGATVTATGSWAANAADRALHRATPQGFDYADDFNDDPDTTHADVMALFDRAIAAEEAHQ